MTNTYQIRFTLAPALGGQNGKARLVEVTASSPVTAAMKVRDRYANRHPNVYAIEIDGVWHELTFGIEHSDVDTAAGRLPIAEGYTVGRVLKNVSQLPLEPTPDWAR